MKKHILLSVIMGLLFLQLAAQTFDGRLIEDETGYMVYQLRQTSGTVTPRSTAKIYEITLDIGWLSTEVEVSDLDIICTDYQIELNGTGKDCGWAPGYCVHTLSTWTATFVDPGFTWQLNTWYNIAYLNVQTTSSGTSDFELWDVTNPNYLYGLVFSYDINNNGVISPSEIFFPNSIQSVTDHAFPETIYDYFWTGNTNNDWNVAANWKVNLCGTELAASTAPVNTTNCFIPSGRTNYPSGTWTGSAGYCNYLRIGSGASVSVTGIHLLQVSSDLILNAATTPGVLTINPDGWVTVNGNTYLSGASQIQVKADGTGVGSFLNQGTISHGAAGSADVETYLTNAGGVGSYYMHQVGATVNNPAYQSANGHPGVYLGQFDIVTLGTYAYRYLEGSNSWENIYPVDTPVPLTQGLILSTIDNTNHHLTMTGQLNTGNITTPFNLGHSGANIDLISNPYPSAIDFDVFQADNSAVVNTTLWIWNPALGSGNYETYTTTSGGLNSGEIQVGQSFFVETNTSAPVQFQNDQRIHSTQPFVKDYYANQLLISVNGFDYGDAAFIHFKENATPGHDYTMDADKWFSIFDEATQVWTISSDMSALTMNAMPMLAEEPVSIPMNVKGGFEGEYTLTASQIESFPAGTQIFLEDLKTGGEWVNLVQNPVYTFTGSPADDQARFVLHFFGPTGIADDLTSSDVQIYSSKQYAYVINNSGKQLKEYVVFDMSGRPVTSGTLTQSTVNRLYVSDITGYYVVKVTSASGEYYSGKVFIGR